MCIHEGIIEDLAGHRWDVCRIKRPESWLSSIASLGDCSAVHSMSTTTNTHLDLQLRGPRLLSASSMVHRAEAATRVVEQALYEGNPCSWNHMLRQVKHTRRSTGKPSKSPSHCRTIVETFFDGATQFLHLFFLLGFCLQARKYANTNTAEDINSRGRHQDFQFCGKCWAVATMCVFQCEFLGTEPPPALPMGCRVKTVFLQFSCAVPFETPMGGKWWWNSKALNTGCPPHKTNLTFLWLIRGNRVLIVADFAHCYFEDQIAHLCAF